MLNQHAGDRARKQLELATHTVVVFFDNQLKIAALEIETKQADRVLHWNREGGRLEFRVRNVGGNYGNRDEMLPERGFDHARLKCDIDAVRHLLRPPILAALDAAANG